VDKHDVDILDSKLKTGHSNAIDTIRKGALFEMIEGLWSNDLWPFYNDF
jgi:hypothetical protein